MIFPNIVLVSFTLFTKILQSHTQNMAKGGIIYWAMAIRCNSLVSLGIASILILGALGL
jgi:hypothetical protein